MKVGFKTFYLTSVSLDHPIDKEKAVQYLRFKESLSWTSFDEYKSCCNILQIFVDKNNWKLSCCTCRNFQKNYMCLHIIGIAYRFKLVDLPNQAKTIGLGEKRKHERPKAKNLH